MNNVSAEVLNTTAFRAHSQVCLDMTPDLHRSLAQTGRYQLCFPFCIPASSETKNASLFLRKKEGEKVRCCLPIFDKLKISIGI